MKVVFAKKPGQGEWQKVRRWLIGRCSRRGVRPIAAVSRLLFSYLYFVFGMLYFVSGMFFFVSVLLYFAIGMAYFVLSFDKGIEQRADLAIAPVSHLPHSHLSHLSTLLAKHINPSWLLPLPLFTKGVFRI